MIQTRKKKKCKTNFENDCNDAIPESVSKLNRIVSYDNTDSDRWKFVLSISYFFLD